MRTMGARLAALSLAWLLLLVGSGADARSRRPRARAKGFHGHLAQGLRREPVAKPSGNVHLFAVNFREEVKVNIYRADGSLDPDALAQLDRLLRCKRTGSIKAIDPRLYEVLSHVYDRFGQRLEVVSGYRNQRRESSKHFRGTASDFRIEGVSERRLRDFVSALDSGGMGVGIYPRAHFIHVDIRAGEPSFRWTDTSRSDGDAPSKRPPRGFHRPHQS